MMFFLCERSFLAEDIFRAVELGQSGQKLTFFQSDWKKGVKAAKPL
jgi:hypothetical protein